MIRQYFPKVENFSSIEECVNQGFLTQVTLESFSSDSINFLDNLSKKLLNDSRSKQFPELISFAYWIRKSNIKNFIDKLKIEQTSGLVARGIAFHIAPSNVDVMFLYSWCLSILVGNINIIRISNKESLLIDFALANLRDMMIDDKYLNILNKNIIINYDRAESVNKYLSSLSDLRILWGGDATVKTFKELPTPAHCKDICFSDKFSYCVINSKNYLDLTDKVKEDIASRFYNDAFWFDQMACSSPQIIYFIGNEQINIESSKIFKVNLDNHLKNKNYLRQHSNTIDHLSIWYKSASKYVQKIDPKITGYTSTFIYLKADDVEVNYKTCGGGIFLICFLEELNDLVNRKSKKDQTMTYLGFTHLELSLFVKSKGLFSPCRVVPIGQALDFDIIWDGYDLILEFSKKVSIK